MEQGAKSRNASQEIMRKALFGLTLCTLLLALTVPTEAQQAKIRA
jgi:hypothetical protein